MQDEVIGLLVEAAKAALHYDALIINNAGREAGTWDGKSKVFVQGEDLDSAYLDWQHKAKAGLDAWKKLQGEGDS